jgi:hypothetical protein
LRIQLRTCMARLEDLKKRLQPGKVYRRNDLTHWSNSVDRHLDELVQEGILQKVAQGLYYYPKKTAFGVVPPDENVLVESFLKDDRFLVTSPNAYNSLGVGTTQLYNTRTVYNHKRHGEFKLGNRTFEFRRRPHFPQTTTPEFLLVDLVNNLDSLAEDQEEVLKNVARKVHTMDMRKVKTFANRYGSVKTKKLFSQFLTQTPQHAD